MRADGKRIKKTDPMYTVASYIMRERNDAMNMITLDIPIEPMQTYIHQKRKEGVRISHMAILVAAYLRTVAEFPMLNRFVVNRKPYARTEYSVAMVVLKNNKDHDGTMTKMYFDPSYTVQQTQETIDKFVEENRNTPENNGTEKIIRILLSVPGLLSVGTSVLMWMDKHGLLPKAIIDMSPFHNSLCISNLASIRTNHIYHHCYNFGTTSVFITLGNQREVAKRKGDEIVFERCMPLGVVMDERICSGSYFASAFRVMQRYLADPSLLEVPPAQVIPDPDL
ncbi:MAG: hypothetical protein IJC52_03780 [Clostridia bacterium]|nr:hypothetical protein [Clostridia bacterium]